MAPFVVCAAVRQILLGIIKWDVVVMGIVFIGMILFGMFFSAAQSAALAPRKEVPSLIPSCPTDIFLPNWSRGCPAALDVTVISSMQPLTLAGAAASPGYALQVAEDHKMVAHFEACRAVGVDFVPVAVESLGGGGGARRLS